MELEIRGVKISFGFSFFWVLAILLCFDFRDEIRLALLFSTLHELGHLTAIIVTRQRPKQIAFGLFGMTIVKRSDMSCKYSAEIFTALAGPLVNVLFSSVFYCAFKSSGKPVFMTAFAVNFLIAAFNLMPVFSLDGGRALECTLKMRFEAQKAEKILKAVSFVFVVIIDFIGAFVLIKSGYNFTLLLIAVYLTATLFIKS